MLAITVSTSGLTMPDGKNSSIEIIGVYDYKSVR